MSPIASWWSTSSFFCSAGWSSVACCSGSSGVSSRSSRTGFSTSSWLSTVSSSMRVSCSSLIACCSDGVITSFWESLRESFCSSAMQRPVVS